MSQSNQEKFFSTLQPFVVLSLISLMTISCGLVGHSDPTNSRRGSASAPTATADKINPITAKPGETIQVTGKDFSRASGLKARFTLSDGSIKDVDLVVASATAASFVMPEGVGLGLKDMKLMQGNAEVQTFSLVANTGDNNLPIIIDESSEICSTKEYIDRNGDKQTGTKNCAGPAACSQDGQKDCVVDGNYAAANTTGLAAKILSGQSIAGVNGSVANCTAGGSNCFLPSYTMTTQPLKAVSFDAISSNAAKIRSGTTLGGVPGSLADCTGNYQQDCVVNGNPLRSANLTNLAVENIKSGVTIAGATGTLANPDPWDLRIGKTVNGVQGKLKVNCRNRVGTYDLGSPNKNTVSHGPNVSTATVIAGWENNDCGGVEERPGDEFVWKDVTQYQDPTKPITVSCGNTHCVFQDKITQLWWTGLSRASDGSLVTYTWPQALNYCENLNYNNRDDWRLPTQLEMMEAYAHGMASVGDNNWIAYVPNFWTATSVSPDASSIEAYRFNLVSGEMTITSKSLDLYVTCVR